MWNSCKRRTKLLNPDCQTDGQATETPEVSMNAATQQSFYSSIKLKTRTKPENKRQV